MSMAVLFLEVIRVLDICSVTPILTVEMMFWDPEVVSIRGKFRRCVLANLGPVSKVNSLTP